MAVDNTLRYRGFNSYNLEAGETLYSSLSDCEYLGFVTTQWVALKVGGTIASGEVRIVWIDDTGGQLGATERHTFTPTRLWERYTWTVAVPPEAVKLRIQFEGGTQGYHFACPMTEPGEIASSFDPNVASAVAYMTSEGAYLGTIAADQVIVSSGEGLEERLVTINDQVFNMTSSISSLDADVTTIKAGQAEFVKFTDIDGSNSTTIIDGGIIKTGTITASGGGAWFDLNKPEIVMEGNQADLSITPENPLKLTDKNGKFIGGLGVAGSILGLVAGAMSNDASMNTYATIGYPAEGGVGISIYEKNYPDVYLGRVGFDSFGISLDHQPRLSMGDSTYLRDGNNVARLWIDQSGNTFLQNAANSHAIGVDGSGPYIIKNSAKSYLERTESGSNANGRYVKFGDGTQICWARRNLGNAAATNGQVSDIWVYPKSFVGIPSVTFTPEMGTTGLPNALQVLFGMGNVESHQARAGIENNNAIARQFHANWHAIGRWK